jgi:hypothetical protein
MHLVTTAVVVDGDVADDMTKRSLLECVVGLAGLDRLSLSLLECVVGRAQEHADNRPAGVARSFSASTAQASCLPVCPSARLPVCRARNSRNVECRLDSQPTKPADDAATGLRCATLQPASLTGVDPLDARPLASLVPSSPWPCPPIASSQTSTYRNLHPSHRCKPNTPTHPLTLLNPTPMPTPLSQRARANVSSRFSIAVWTLHPDWARASPDSDWDSSFAV